MPASGWSGSERVRMTSGSQICAPSRYSTSGRPVTVSAVGVEQVRDLAQHRQQAAGAVEVLHEEASRRLQVDEQRNRGADAVEVVQRQLDPEPPGDGQQVDDGVGGAADRGQRDDRVEERATAEQGAGAAVLARPSRWPRGPAAWAASSRRLSAAGVPARPGSVVPSDSAITAIVEAVPIVLQWPRLRIIEDSDCRKSSRDSVPARTSSESLHTSVPQPSATPRKVPLSIGPPGTTIAGRSTDAAAMSSAGIVLSQPPRSTRPSIGLARNISSAAIAAMLRHSIAVGRTLRLAQGHHRQVHRDAAGLVDALLDALGDLVEVRVARRQIRGGVGDGDVRASVEGVAGQPAPHPRAVDVGVAVGPGVPVGAADRRPSACGTYDHIRDEGVRRDGRL